MKLLMLSPTSANQNSGKFLCLDYPEKEGSSQPVVSLLRLPRKGRLNSTSAYLLLSTHITNLDPRLPSVSHKETNLVLTNQQILSMSSLFLVTLVCKISPLVQLFKAHFYLLDRMSPGS